MERKFLDPEVYSIESRQQLRRYLKVGNGKVSVKKEYIHEGLSGPFDLLADYGTSLEDLRKPTEISYSPENVDIHALSNPQVQTASDNLTLLANSGIDFNDPYFGALYATNFTSSFISPLEAAVQKADGGWTLIAPLRGGEVVHIIANTRGYSPNIPQIRASRVILRTREYLVGVTSLDSKILVENTVVLGDDCLAAAGSADTVLRWARMLNPDLQEVHVAVGVGVKRSTEMLAQILLQDGLSPTINIGAGANAMDDDYYLRITDEERRKIFPDHCIDGVGDMGAAMNLTDPERRKILVPAITAVAEERIGSELIFDLTTRVIDDPSSLHSEAKKLLAEAKRR